MSVEITRTRFKEYPRQFSVSVPVRSVELPSVLEAELPQDTTHIEHLVYLGRQIHEGEGGTVYRNFWEERRASSNPSGYRASPQEYHEILDEQGVPRPPEEGRWVPEAFLYVATLRSLAAVEFPDDPTARQSRITVVRRNHPQEALPGARQFDSVQSASQYVARLEGLGFPQGSFDHLKKWYHRLPYIVFPDRRLVHTIRTENSRR